VQGIKKTPISIDLWFFAGNVTEEHIRQAEEYEEQHTEKHHVYDTDDDWGSRGPEAVLFHTGHLNSVLQPIAYSILYDHRRSLLTGVFWEGDGRREDKVSWLYTRWSIAVPPGEWHHVAFVPNARGTLENEKLFLDGNYKPALQNVERDGEVPFKDFDLMPSPVFMIGRRFFGKVDDVRVWDMNIDNESIHGFRATSCPESTRKLTHYLNFNECRGYAVQDVAPGGLCLETNTPGRVRFMEGPPKVVAMPCTPAPPALESCLMRAHLCKAGGHGLYTNPEELERQHTYEVWRVYLTHAMYGSVVVIMLAGIVWASRRVIAVQFHRVRHRLLPPPRLQRSASDLDDNATKST